MRDLLLILLLLVVSTAHAQIQVHPNGVNVNAGGATTVFLTFGGLGLYQPAEAFWCGRLIDAAPDIGTRCDPATLFGQLPLRFDFSTREGGMFTDIMSIPPSVARRAYQAAADDPTGDSRFYYVRRFTLAGAPDVYVRVTCRMAGGGARVPFALTDVRVGFERDAAVLSVKRGETPPAFFAEIAYNGTGQLRGRWEVVRPGDERPEVRDLLTEATLPVAQRGTQRRYTALGTFSFFLPPSVQPILLPGPDPERLPTAVEGPYEILLRIEATDDKEGDSNLASAGAGTGVVHTGGVAGFPMPPLRYYVGAASSTLAPLAPQTPQALAQEQTVQRTEAGLPMLAWTPLRVAAVYRVEIRTAESRTRVLTALVPGETTAYALPPWVGGQTPETAFQWRVEAVDFGGNRIDRTDWSPFVLNAPASTDPLQH